MGDRRIGVIINGATGRMGTTQHMANLLAIAAEGGLKLDNGDRLIPDLLLVGRDAGRLAKLAAAHGKQRWTTNLDEALAGAGPDLHGLRRHGRSSQARPPGHRSGQAHPYREADGAHGRRSDGAGAAGRPRRPQAWRHPGQAVPARLRQAAVGQQVGVLRPHPVGEDRCRLVDLRRHRAGMPAPELELPEVRGRRPRARYDGALALHDRSAGGAGHRCLRADEHGHPASGSTKTGDATPSTPRTRTTPC